MKYQKTGVLLVNLGTPDNYSFQAVWRYLMQFLNDPRVVDLPTWIRWVLMNLWVIPKRVKHSMRAYSAIWQKEGSPLLLNSLRLQEAIAEKLGEIYQVSLGMRYGNPSIESALKTLQHCKKIIIFPLFPQYASAVTGSALEKTISIISNWESIPEIRIYRDFYHHAGFINAYADLIKKATARKTIDLFLFSYHGLPKRQINKINCLAVCENAYPCSVEKDEHSCYRAQCYITSKALARACGLSESICQTAFQSRLSGTPWIEPYTDQLLPNFIQQGIKNIAVVCPSFVSDCLETLEEIGIKMRNEWQRLGGDTFILIPCLNDNPLWINALLDIFENSFYS